jgi:Nodulin-like
MTAGSDGRSVAGRSNVPLLTSAFLASLTTGGNTYAFGIYGSALKKALQLSQSQLDTISSANFCAGLLSWIPGLFADKYGPRFALSVGGILGAASLLSYWVVAREFIELPRSLLIPSLCTLGVLIFLTNSLVIGGIFKIFVGTCGPGTKGSAVGAAKGYVGLGSGAYACLFQALRVESSSDLDFLPMAAVFAVLAAAVPALILLPSKENIHFDPAYDRITPLHLRSIYFGLVGLGSLVVGTSIAAILSYDEENNGNKGGRHFGMALLLLAFWCGPIVALLFLPTHEEEIVEETSGQYEPPTVFLTATADADKQNSDESTTENKYEPKNKRDGLAMNVDQSEMPQGYTLYEMLKTVPAWLFAWICIILVGGGTIMTNNMGQMVEALYFPEVITPASLALFSAAQASSRVVTGAVSDWALQWNTTMFGNGVPRPVFLVAASFAGAAAHLLLSVASSQGSFVIGVAMSGAAFGMIWPLMVLIVGEVFGTSNVGANYMFFDGGASALGTLFLSKFVAQTVYELHIDHDDENSDGLTCYGEDCFRASHLIVALLSLTCLLASVGMLRMTRHAHSGLSLHYDSSLD